jgi:hypothetical protein
LKITQAYIQNYILINLKINLSQPLKMVLPHQTATIHDKYHISDPKAANLTLYQNNKSVGITERLSMKWQSWHL